jgi:hypothetical protein
VPRKTEFAERYTDALQALEVATGRPARVTNINGRYALRVDFEFGRYLTATKADSFTGLGDADAGDPWRVRVFEPAAGDESLRILADQSAMWLIDAYDAAVVELPPAAAPIGR